MPGLRRWWWLLAALALPCTAAAAPPRKGKPPGMRPVPRQEPSAEPPADAPSVEPPADTPPAEPPADTPPAEPPGDTPPADDPGGDRDPATEPPPDASAEPKPEPPPPEPPPAPPKPPHVSVMGTRFVGGGEVPGVIRVLSKTKEGVARCVTEHGGLEADAGDVEVQFLVRARGRAEGVDVLSTQAVGAEAARCVRMLLKHKSVGRPTSDPVGVVFHYQLRPAK